jgi:hypothetical protein
MSETTLVKQLADELSRIFRHMLPGLAVVGVAAASHPSWLRPLLEQELTGWRIALLGAVALTVGNAWYVFHRYTLHQIVDYAVYIAKNHRIRGYLSWLREHVYTSFHLSESEAKLREHIHLRSAQLIFLFIIAEALIVFAIEPETGSFVARHQRLVELVGLGALLWCALVQFPIGDSLDTFQINRHHSH